MKPTEEGWRQGELAAGSDADPQMVSLIHHFLMIDSVRSEEIKFPISYPSYQFLSRPMNKKKMLDYGALSVMALSISIAYAQDAKQHTYDSFQIANGAFMDFKRIEPGTFIMGSKDEKRQDADGPPHKVTITKPFYLGKYEVTQSQWNHVMRKLTWSNPSSFGGRLSNPVESISWLEVQEFIAKINEFDGGDRYRLPGEAES